MQRLCGYSNPQLNVPQYPIPLPEDVFVKLQGEQGFTKIDLKSAYQQLPLDPDSQMLVTSPENSTQLQAFLGMINYHGKFIRNLSTILQPLNQLLQKNQEFRWSAQCEQAFNEAKDSLSSSNVLVHYDPSLPVILESDASQHGIGAVILHRFPNGDERLIAYASRSLNSLERNYSQIEKEGLAIIFGVTKYYIYLFG